MTHIVLAISEVSIRNQCRCHHKYSFPFFLFPIFFYSSSFHISLFHLSDPLFHIICFGFIICSKLFNLFIPLSMTTTTAKSEMRIMPNATQVGQMKCKFIGCRTHWIKSAFLFCSSLVHFLIHFLFLFFFLYPFVSKLCIWVLANLFFYEK